MKPFLSWFASRWVDRHVRAAFRRSKPRVWSGKRHDLSVIEELEQRTLLSTVSGTVYKDLTGDGLTADDTPFAARTVQLVRHEAGTVYQQVMTSADGQYSFTVSPTGRL